MKKLQEQVRELLRKNEDGLTVPEIARALGPTQNPRAVRAELINAMGDAYIDRYTQSAAGGQYSPVWCVVAVPENCPMPDRVKVSK